MKDNIIIPYCIYHYIDPDTHTYYGYLGNPHKTKLTDGTVTYKCPPEPKIYKKWFLYGTFYAVSPNFRPIPMGMRIFCAQKYMGAPYGTKEIADVYDPFNVKDECVYFITYNKPVPNTSPLYFHKFGENVFPSFDPNPPSNDHRWGQTKISPVFVMTPDTVGNKNIKFKCVNGSCIPWIKDIPDIYDIDVHDKLLDLDKCVLYCNELIISKGDGRPFNLIELIKSEKIKKPVISRFFKKIPPLVIGLCVSIFLVLLFSIIYISTKQKWFL
jgi:hypothetical protein